MKKHFHCPINDIYCPYYTDEFEGEFRICLIGNPIEECDDFYAEWGDSSPEEYTHYTKKEEEEK